MKAPNGELPLFTIRVNEEGVKGKKLVVLIGFSIVIIDPLFYMAMLYGLEDISDFVLWGGAAILFILALLAMTFLQWIFNRYTKPVNFYHDGVEFKRNLISIIARREGYIPKDELVDVTAYIAPHETDSSSMTIKTKQGRTYLIGQRFTEDIQRATKLMREGWRVPVIEKAKPQVQPSSRTGSNGKGVPSSSPSTSVAPAPFFFCANCGMKLQDEFAFCPACGRRKG